MKKLSSTLTNMVLSLTLITMFAAAILASIYLLTKDTIEAQKTAKQTEAIGKVLPAQEGLTILDAEQKDDLTIYKACNAEGELVGTAVETSANGFNGALRVMVGFDKDGNIVDYIVLEQQETPGLGANMPLWFKTDKNDQSIIGRNVFTDNLTVKKDGGSVDAITAATITSRAFLLAINKAKAALDENVQPSAYTGASVIENENSDVKEQEVPVEIIEEPVTEN